mgnify:CR=1 FL=1
MAKLSAKGSSKNRLSAKKPSTRSKTGNAACSEAASNWQLSLRGKAALSPDTYQTLAKCRAQSKAAKQAEGYGRTGKLSAQGEAAVKGRLQQRFDRGLITQKARTERLGMLLKQRAERGKMEAAKPVVAAAKPSEPRTAKNTGTYGDYYFTPDGKYVQMRGSGGLGSDRVRAYDINGKMVNYYGRGELRFANEKQRPTKESEAASERLASVSKTVSDLREKHAKLLIGKDVTDKLKREIESGKLSKEKFDDLVKRGYALSDADYRAAQKAQSEIEIAKSILAQPTPPPKPPEVKAEAVRTVIENGREVKVYREERGPGFTGFRKDPVPEPKPKSSMAEGRTSRALDKQMGFNGVFMSRRKAMENAVSKGYEITLSPAGTRRLMDPKTQGFWDESQISKTAMDYAEKLIKERAPTPPAAKYSLGGKLAPGRGTEERKARAAFNIAIRSGNAQRIAATGEALSIAKGSKIKFASGADSHGPYVVMGMNRRNVSVWQSELKAKTRAKLAR